MQTAVDMPVSKMNASQGAHWEAAGKLLASFRPIADTNCPLFARKFAAEDAKSIAVLAKNFTDLRTVVLAQNQSKDSTE